MKMQGRLSAMRDLVLIGALIALVVGGIGVISFMTASRNRGGPQTITLMDLVEGQIEAGTYVKVTGVAIYGAYEYTEDDVLTTSYSWLADEKTGDVVVVRDADARFVVPDPARVSIEGMVRTMPSDLKALVQDDQVAYPEVFLADSVIIAEGDKPPSLEGSLAMMLFGLGAGIVGVIFYVVLPPYVFKRRAPAYDAHLTADRPAIKVTATMHKMKTLEPLTWGPNSQKFRNGVANLVPYQGALLLYIHYIVKNRVYGVQVSKNETDWGLLLNHENVTGVETGSLMGWKDRPALRIRYNDKKQKLREALVIFENEDGLYTGKLLMDKLGFAVETGDVD